MLLHTRTISDLFQMLLSNGSHSRNPNHHFKGSTLKFYTPSYLFMSKNVRAFEPRSLLVHAQGEQCNVVPDTIDDIVADIGQEEKEDGTV